MRKKRTKPTCFWCARELNKPTDRSSMAFTLDHIYPKSLGGRKKVPCCIACNSLKGDKTPGEWTMFMMRNPEWWKLYRAHRPLAGAGKRIRENIRWARS